MKRRVLILISIVALASTSNSYTSSTSDASGTDTSTTASDSSTDSTTSSTSTSPTTSAAPTSSPTTTSAASATASSNALTVSVGQSISITNLPSGVSFKATGYDSKLIKVKQQGKNGPFMVNGKKAGTTSITFTSKGKKKSATSSQPPVVYSITIQ